VTSVRSLRSRLILGGLLWTIALAIVAHFIVRAVITRHPGEHVRVLAHFSLLSLGAVCLVAVGLWLLRRGLAPFRQLRERLSSVRAGIDRRVEGSYPTEVQPLVNDLNALLEDREQRVARAVAKAGDLAHGLKTPLAVLAQEAERAEAEGHRDLADTIGQQVVRMRRQIDYHLAHARAAASGSGGARCSVAESAEGLSRTLLRLHAGRGLSIDVRVSPLHAVKAQREDLDEMLGNLLDNACKWAKSRVTVASSENEGTVSITVDDNGPGIDPSMRDRVLQRGVRADEAAPGSGLGLAIVRDLAELYGGSISLDRSEEGGVRARLQLPVASR
jgi:signal transduction histidine kinase